MDAVFKPRLRGHVRQWDLESKTLLNDVDNLVVDSSFEVMLAALFHQQYLTGIAFGFTNNRPVTHDLRTLSSLLAIAPLNSTPDTQSFITMDQDRLRSIGTVTGILRPSTPMTYDTVGLITNTNLLFAAANVPQRTITKPIATEWTIFLRG